MTSKSTVGRRRSNGERSTARSRSGAAAAPSRTHQDLVLMGALLALVANRAGGAGPTGTTVPATEQPDSFAQGMGGLRGESTEAAMLVALAEDLHRTLTAKFARHVTPVEPPDLIGEFLSQKPEAQSAEVLSPTQGEDAAQRVIDHATQAPEPPSLDGLTVAAAKPAATEAKKSLKVDKTTYAEQSQKVKADADAFLEAMRELFQEEIAELAESAEDSEELKTASSTQWAPALGLAGLGGGGGGGVSALASAGASFSGFAIDGYVAGARVFWDKNNNFEWDSGEAFTFTDSSGAYSLSGVTKGVGQIVVEAGGIDTSTGGTVGLMAASTSVGDTGRAMVTPLTMLMAQGVSEASLLAALNVTADQVGAGISSLDPVSLLQSQTADAVTKAAAGKLLLKAQQLFTVVNALTTLASGISVEDSAADASKKMADAQAKVLSELGKNSGTLGAMVGELDGFDAIGDHTGEYSSASAQLEALILTVAPTFNEGTLAADIAKGITGVNAAIGSYLNAPENALDPAVRAAALVSQSDLMDQIRIVAKLDPIAASTQIASRLASFQDPAAVKANFAEIYTEMIAAMASNSAAILTGVDDITVVAGQTIDVATQILKNDRNPVTGSELKLLGFEPIVQATDWNVTLFSEVPTPHAAVAQVSTITVANTAVTVTLNGTPIVEPAAQVNDPNRLASLESSINALTATTGVVATVVGSNLVLTGKDDGSKFTVAVSGSGASATTTTEGQQAFTTFDYALEMPSAEHGDYVKLTIGKHTLVFRASGSDLEADVNAAMANMPADFRDVYDISMSGAQLTLHKKDFSQIDGFEVGSSKFAMSMLEVVQGSVYDFEYSDGKITMPTDHTGKVNLKYYVTNGKTMASGVMRAMVAPETQTLKLDNTNASPQTVLEDASLVLDGRFDLEGNNGTGVTQSIFVKLTAMTPSSKLGGLGNEDYFELLVGDSDPVPLKLGQAVQIKLGEGQTIQDILSAARVSLSKTLSDTEKQQLDFHGTIKLQYLLLSEKGEFNTISSVTETISVTPSAQGDAPVLKYGLSAAGQDFYDAADGVVPAVLSPTSAQIVRFKLDGGDDVERRTIVLNGVPNNLAVEYSYDNKIFQKATVDNSAVSIPEGGTSGGTVFVKFLASQALLDTAFGLSDPITAFVLHEEVDSKGGVIDSANSETISFQIDVGGTFGMVVGANAVTRVLEGDQTALGGLDVISVGEGMKVEAVITLRPGFELYDGTEKLESDLVDGGKVYRLTSEQYIAAVVNNLNDPLNFLDGLTIKPIDPHFKDSTTVEAKLTAIRTLKDGVTEVKATETAKSIEIRFLPVASGVEFGVGGGGELWVTALTATEDHPISLYDAIFKNGNGIASLVDGEGTKRESLFYVISGEGGSALPAGLRIVNKDVLSFADSESLKSTITQASSIGTVVGNTIELSEEEAKSAVLVTTSDGSLAPAAIRIAAVSKEPNTALVSEITDASSADLNVAITGVADGAILSYDESVRGLVNVSGIDPALLPKTKITIPLLASLQDTDGSENLVARISVATGSGNITNSADFQISGLNEGDDYLLDLVNKKLVVFGNALKQLAISSTKSFDGQFRVEVISAEKEAGTRLDALMAVQDNNASVEIQHFDLRVKFLKPATVPLVQFKQLFGAQSELGPIYRVEGGRSLLEFKLKVESDPQDKLTLLMTGIPSTSSSDAKVYNVVNGVETAIGAPAEVKGVWVFQREDFVDGNGTEALIRVVLPAGYTSADNAKFDVTAFAVDEVGITNASSSALLGTIPNVVTAAELVDPLVLDVTSNGLELRSSPLVRWDVNGDGATEQVGWLAEKTTITNNASLGDAFLVIKGPNQNWKLITEYLVDPQNPLDSDAIEDLRSFAGSDGILRASDADFNGYQLGLWFAGVNQSLPSDNSTAIPGDKVFAVNDSTWSINLNDFKASSYYDNGALVAGNVPKGGLTGLVTIPKDVLGNPSNITIDLSNSTLYDVFLPVSREVTSAKEVLDDVILGATPGQTMLEDAEDGFSLTAALSDAGWATGLQSNGNNLANAKVLLTVSAAEAGMHFNLSQGARLTGQPTETWLVQWNPLDGAATDLRLFAADNYSGPIKFNLRASVTYPDLSAASVSRNVTLNVTPVLDLPLVQIPTQAVRKDESLDGNNVIDLGILLQPNDASESVTLTLRPPTALANLMSGANASAWVDFNGTKLSLTNGAISVNGPITADALKLVVPQDLSGKFDFTVNASSVDQAKLITASGTTDVTASDRPVSNLPLTVVITPMARKPLVTLTTTAATGTEATGWSHVLSMAASPTDQDGSEEITSVLLKVTATGPMHGGLPVLKIGAQSFTLAFARSGVQGQEYELRLNKSQFAVDATGKVTLSGTLTMPSYFDQTDFKASISATSVEKSMPSVQAVASAEVSLTAAAQADGFVSALQAAAVAVLGGDKFRVSSLLRSNSLKDPDELIQIELTLPSGYSVTEGPGVLRTSTSGNITLTGTANGIQNSWVNTPSEVVADSKLSFKIATTDGAAVLPAVSLTSDIIVTPVVPPTVFVTNVVINEGGTGGLSFQVALGNVSFPTGVDVVISGVPNGFGLSMPGTSGSELKSFGDNGYKVDAASLRGGLIIKPKADLAMFYSGEVVLKVTASKNYQFSDGLQVRESTAESKLTVSPVVQGFGSSKSLIFDEGQEIGLLDIFTLADRDGSESVSSVSIKSITEGITFDSGTRKFILPPNYNGQFSFELSVTFVDKAGNLQATREYPVSGTVTVNPVATKPEVLGIIDGGIENLLVIKDEDGVTIDGPIIVEPSKDTILKLSFARFNTPDSKEKLSIELAGLPAGSFVSADGEDVSVKWRIEGDVLKIEPRDSGQFTSSFSLKLTIPAGTDLAEALTITTTAVVEDRSAKATATSEDTVAFADAVPLPPGVSLSTDLARTGIGAVTPLSALVHIKELNANQVVEVIGLQGRLLKPIDSGPDYQEIDRVPLVTNDGAPLFAYRLYSIEELNKVIVTDYGDRLVFSARVGNLDSSSTEYGNLYVYTRPIEIDIHLGANASIDNDYLRANTQILDALDGDDVVVASAVGGRISGGKGRDTLVMSNNQLGVVVDLLAGQMATKSGGDVSAGFATVREVNGFEIVVGSDGNDILAGGSDAVLLRGGDGDDDLLGGDGNDVLEGGAGNDFLSGGIGADKFVLAPGSGADEIEDFELGVDQIVLAGFDLKVSKSGLPAGVTLNHDDNGNWTVSVGTSGSSFKLLGIAAAVGVGTIHDAIADSIVVANDADLVAPDPFGNAFAPRHPLEEIIADAGFRASYFGADKDFSDLETTLQVVVSAAQEVAVVKDLSMPFGEIKSFSLDGYIGFAGTKNDDTLFANDRDSLLYGGSGGNDYLVGGAGHDYLLTQTRFDTDSQITLAGNGGHDVFAIYVQPPSTDPLTNEIIKTKIEIEDFNRYEGDRILLIDSSSDYSGRELSTDSSPYLENGRWLQEVGYGDALTLVFDVSFIRDIDTNFTIKPADFDKI
jgi:hypothetical protein